MVNQQPLDSCMLSSGVSLFENCLQGGYKDQKCLPHMCTCSVYSHDACTSLFHGSEQHAQEPTVSILVP